jgi:hypothetical protein
MEQVVMQVGLGNMQDYRKVVRVGAQNLDSQGH